MKKNQRVFIILGIFFVVLLVLFTIILFVIKRENAEEKEINRENEIKNTCYLTVLFDEDILDEEIQEIGVEISEMKGVINCDYVTADEVQENFKNEYFKDSDEAAEGVKNDNPLASSANYEVEADYDKVDEIVTAIERIKGVRKINQSVTEEKRGVLPFLDDIDSREQNKYMQRYLKRLKNLKQVLMWLV